MKKKLWLVIHEHSEGITDYLVSCDRQPTEEEIVSSLNLDFDPEVEVLTLTKFSVDQVVEIL